MTLNLNEPCSAHKRKKADKSRIEGACHRVDWKKDQPLPKKQSAKTKVSEGDDTSDIGDPSMEGFGRTHIETK